MQMAVRGVCYLITNGSMISQTGENWKFLGQGFVFGVIPVSVLIMLLSAVVLFRPGPRPPTIQSPGTFSAPSAPPDSRWSPRRALSGLFMGLAGVLYTSRANCGVATGAQGYEGQAISATVIGGIGYHFPFFSVFVFDDFIA